MCAKKATHSNKKKKASAKKSSPKKKSSERVKVVSTKKTTASVEASPKKTPSPSAPPRTADTAVLPFGRMNYILLIVGVLIIGLGFFLMSLDDFVDATRFSISLYIAPLVVVAGFIEIIYAIMYQPKKEKPSTL